MNIGDKLRELRLQKNMTQKGMADVIGVNRTTYAKYESGDIELSASMAIVLCDFFNISTDYLLGRDTPETEKDPSAEESKMVNEISYIYDKLSDEAKEKLLEYCSDLLGNPKNLK